ncbi:hypothetical protein [Eubacterium oxidoreducens]|uniref:Ig-like domain (Group 3) n=1 Tax=Eubacterium oxidoreducens TaxID=1732 RepID=A0A1G6BLC6_EUBOX|nr:hypothetical protein [Eubacterium oxidoreducens]SDB21401.1 hypothetical protein SAMN02910417_01599 [Eubacterium oxidoreducens]
MKKTNLIGLIILIVAIAAAAFMTYRRMQSGDGMAPIIRMSDTKIEISVEDDESVILDGVSATDVTDGDVTDSLVVEKISAFMEDGRRIATLAAFDSDNEVGVATREIVYTDYKPTRISITEPLVFTLNTTSFLEGVTAKDCLDGDLSGQLKFSDSGQIETDAAGVYDMQLEVTNSAGDISRLPIKITMMSSESMANTPVIYLKNFVKYVNVGDSIDYESLIKKCEYLGVEYEAVEGKSVGESTIGRSKFAIDTSDVDLNTPGNYIVTYTVSINDSSKAKAYLYVVVEDE